MGIHGNGWDFGWYLRKLSERAARYAALNI